MSRAWRASSLEPLLFLAKVLDGALTSAVEAACLDEGVDLMELTDIRAKHDGQLTVARLAWQYGQRPACGSAAAPQFGQCKAKASLMTETTIR